VQGKATYDPDSTFSNMLNARPSPWSFWTGSLESIAAAFSSVRKEASNI
jgi:hypothetical protein